MKVAIIGGTGLRDMGGAKRYAAVADATTPYGVPSAVPELASVGGAQALFMDRHGPARIAPHLVNYRANLWLLRDLGAELAIGVYAVGAIDRACATGDIVVPHQIIDYSWGREHTYVDAPARHVDFGEPYDAALRQQLIQAAASCIPAERLHREGVYACTQGPRLESAAEVDRLARDGCTVVGMTGMPEAGLARELGLPFAGLCISVNPAAGRGQGSISEADIAAAAKRGAADIEGVLRALAGNLGDGADAAGSVNRETRTTAPKRG